MAGTGGAQHTRRRAHCAKRAADCGNGTTRRRQRLISICPAIRRGTTRPAGSDTRRAGCGGTGREAGSEAGHAAGGAQHPRLPRRTAAATGARGNSAGRGVRAAPRAAATCGPLHPGRQGTALFHRAHAGPASQNCGLPRSHSLHAAGTGRTNRPGNSLRRPAVRHRPRVPHRWGTGGGGHGLRHGKHTARGQNLRSRQPLRDQGETVGAGNGGHRYAGRPERGTGDGGRNGTARLRGGGYAVAGGTRAGQPGPACVPLGSICTAGEA